MVQQLVASERLPLIDGLRSPRSSSGFNLKFLARMKTLDYTGRSGEQ